MKAEMENRTFSISNAIKVAVVATAVPRWTGALMVSEGVPLPASWLATWRWLVLALTIGMAIAEAFGISYMLHAARIQGDQKSKWITPIVLVNFAVFAIIIAPYAYANMRGISVSEALPVEAIAWLWAIAVPLSTGAIVAGIGFADRSKAVTNMEHNTERYAATNRNTPELKAELVTLYSENPQISLRAAARAVGVSHTTVKRYVDELVVEGLLASRNGHG